MVNFNTDARAIFIVFIGAIITATFIGVIADSTFTETNTISRTNITVTPAAVNTTLDLEGRELLTTVSVVNSSNGSQSLIGFGGSLQTGISSTTGLLSVQLILNDTAADFTSDTVNVSYTANPNGYVSDAGGRSITNLIVIFSALAIMIFAIVVFAKEGTLGKFLRGEK